MLVLMGLKVLETRMQPDRCGVLSEVFADSTVLKGFFFQATKFEARINQVFPFLLRHVAIPFYFQYMGEMRQLYF